MDTFLVKSQMSEDDVVRIASDHLHEKIQSVSKIGGGANNRVYHLASLSREYVAKFYYQHPLDGRDRLGIEFNSFSFLWQQGLRMVPRPVGISRENHCAFYEFVKGTPIGPHVSQADIETAVDFLETLHRLSLQSLSANLSTASEAFFSVQEVVNSIQGRLDRIDSSMSGEEYNHLRRYLDEEFLPLFKTVAAWSKDYLQDNGVSYEALLPAGFRTLSPSDFGFHNALRVDGSKIVFLDFEYFGWDDPAKLVSDFLWHPAMSIPEDLKALFVQRASAVFKKDPYFKARLKGVFPLFGLKWCLIFLNEFISTGSDRRDFANCAAQDKTTVRHEQLRKAQLLNTKIKALYQDFPYGS